MKLGATIKAMREEIGMTQTVLAYESDISRKTSIAYEKDRHSPRTNDLEQIAAALKTTAWKIVNKANLNRNSEP